MTTQKLISRGLIGLAIGFGCLWGMPALADTPVPPGPGVTIDVTGVAEPASPDPDANCTGTGPVTCPSLREAIMFANGNAATDGTQTQDTIVLPEGTYVLTIEGADETFDPVSNPDEAPGVTNAPDAALGDLDLTESVIIQGAGSALTVIQWDDAATVKVFDDASAAPVTTLPMVSDGDGKPTVLTSGTLLFHVIDRGGEQFLRVRDRNSPTLAAFEGIDRFPVDPRWRVTARLIPEPGATIAITNVLGQVETSPCPGALEFDLEGQTHRLRPTVSSDGSLFFVFADTTNGQQTYGAGRFLDADPIGDDGLVELDFNKAHNPICSMSEFATCPLPPTGNRLPIAVEAGEKYRQ